MLLLGRSSGRQLCPWGGSRACLLGNQPSMHEASSLDTLSMASSLPVYIDILVQPLVPDSIECAIV